MTWERARTSSWTDSTISWSSRSHHKIHFAPLHTQRCRKYCAKAISSHQKGNLSYAQLYQLQLSVCHQIRLYNSVS